MSVDCYSFGGNDHQLFDAIAGQVEVGNDMQRIGKLHSIS